MVKIEMESGNACVVEFLTNGNRVAVRATWESPPNDDDLKAVERMIDDAISYQTRGRYVNDGIIGPDVPNVEREIHEFLMGGTNAN